MGSRVGGAQKRQEPLTARALPSSAASARPNRLEVTRARRAAAIAALRDRSRSSSRSESGGDRARCGAEVGADGGQYSTEGA